MTEYIRIRAIEALKDRLDFGGGIASGEPSVASVQADYLVALSNGLPLENLRLQRVLPLDVILFDQPEVATFQALAEIIIRDLVPALDAEFISSPLAEVGSIRWRPAIRTSKRFTAKELAEWEKAVEVICRQAIKDHNDGGDDPESVETGPGHEFHRAMLNSQDVMWNCRDLLNKADNVLAQSKIQGSLEEIHEAMAA